MKKTFSYYALYCRYILCMLSFVALIPIFIVIHVVAHYRKRPIVRITPAFEGKKKYPHPDSYRDKVFSQSKPAA